MVWTDWDGNVKGAADDVYLEYSSGQNGYDPAAVRAHGRVLNNSVGFFPELTYLWEAFLAKDRPGSWDWYELEHEFMKSLGYKVEVVE